MASLIKEIVFPQFDFNQSTVDEYCKFIQKSKWNGFWWYLFPHPVWGRTTLPFQNNEGHWFYCIRPGVAWAVEWDKYPTLPPYPKSWLAWQAPIQEESANSFFTFRGLMDLDAYSSDLIDSKRRTIIRRGLRDCNLSLCNQYDKDLFVDCYQVWNEHIERTGWKSTISFEYFESSWKELLDCPAVTIMVGHNQETGQCIGWQIIKIFGSFVYGDAIASISHKAGANVNDAIIYSLIMNAKQVPGINSLYYGIASNIDSIEKFKDSIGLKKCKIPSTLKMNPLAHFAGKLLFPERLQQLKGR